MRGFNWMLRVVRGFQGDISQRRQDRSQPGRQVDDVNLRMIVPRSVHRHECLLSGFIEIVEDCRGMSMPELATPKPRSGEKVRDSGNIFARMIRDAIDPIAGNCLILVDSPNEIPRDAASCP